MTPPQPQEKAPVSAFAPFQHGAFALLWTATLLSNIGTWMHDVSAAWLMTSVSTSPFLVAAVQAATTFAMALFALPAGAMADLFDRRKLLALLSLIKASLALCLGALTVLGLVQPWSLLLVTFLMGVCAALISPVFQSIVPTLVPRDVLKPAVAMNSLGVNLARAIGPTIGGVLIVLSGAATAFFLNALSEFIIIAALLVWKPVQTQRTSEPEQLVSAIVAGLRFAAYSAALKNVLWRAAAFFLFASAFWALLPLVARQSLRGDAGLYGMLVGAVGAGAVAGATLLSRLDRKLGPDRLVAAGSLVMAAVLAMLSVVQSSALAIATTFLAGIGWILVLSSLNAAAQQALPDWVRGRGLSIYGLIFFGAMTAGSLGWGLLAIGIGVPAAFGVAAVGMTGGILAVRRKAITAEPLDLTPAGHWPDPPVAIPVPGDRGPVMVTIDYVINPAQEAAFREAMLALSAERRRDGAYQWGLMQDVAEPSRFTEYFLVESWAEHERQHRRVTKADAAVQAKASAFHTGAQPPAVRHLVGTSRASH